MKESYTGLVGATIYRSPVEEPIANGAILIHDGKIVGVGARNDVDIPAAAQLIDCSGGANG